MFIVYGKSGCKYCELARGLLADRGEVFQYVDVKDHMDELLSECNKHYFIPKTVPQIFIKDTANKSTSYIGGYTELHTYLTQKPVDNQNLDVYAYKA